MDTSELGQKYQRFLQMFWDPEPKNDDPKLPSIFCLGVEYSAKDFKETLEGSNSGPKNTNSDTSSLPTLEWPKSFLDDFESRLWFTYRSNFPPIPRSSSPEASLTFAVRLRNIGETNGFTSDTGWGCMIRSGQSLLANALMILKYGRNRRISDGIDIEKELISWFADDPRSPFSIHNFVNHGAEYCGKRPGEWFGPSATAKCIQSLSNSFEPAGLQVYIAEDGAQLYEGSIKELSCANSSKAFRPVLLLAGVRLGIDRITPVYRDAIESILKMPQSIGIAGGRPSASHYFVAVQGTSFFYLDPHYTRPALPFHDQFSDYSAAEVQSCHTRRLRRLNIDNMDPSMLLSFLITSEDDFQDWKRSIQNLSGKPILDLVEGYPPRDTSLEREAAIEEVESFDDLDKSDEE